ncbi:MAG: type II toxin-antitoxin system VapC family toxin [Deltaproteobacteria bacterium]|nr:type II toxin-antitoxin system VapC family toxin [Deltaproteobacteria bacterium]
MTEILDASVAVKWFVREGEAGLAAADEVLHRVLRAPEHFAVPALFVYEVHAVLCRRRRSAAEVNEDARALWALALPVVQPDQRLLELAADIALEHRLTAYDAAYAALARHLGGIWLTFDEPAYRRIRRLHIARLLPLA